jgi:hypothetical protein
VGNRLRFAWRKPQDKLRSEPSQNSDAATFELLLIQKESLRSDIPLAFVHREFDFNICREHVPRSGPFAGLDDRVEVGGNGSADRGDIGEGCRQERVAGRRRAMEVQS